MIPLQRFFYFVRVFYFSYDSSLGFLSFCSISCFSSLVFVRFPWNVFLIVPINSCKDLWATYKKIEEIILTWSLIFLNYTPYPLLFNAYNNFSYRSVSQGWTKNLMTRGPCMKIKIHPINILTNIKIHTMYS